MLHARPNGIGNSYGGPNPWFDGHLAQGVPAKFIPKKIELADFLKAAREGELDSVISFLDHGVDIDYRDHKGRSALILAAKNGKSCVVNELLKRGAFKDAKDDDGNTALMLAAINGIEKAVKILLLGGAKVNEINCRSQTALSLVREKMQSTDGETREAFFAIEHLLLVSGAE